MRKCLMGSPNTSNTLVQKTTKNREKNNFLLESELINRDHRTNSKQQRELHQNEKRNDEPGFPV